MRKWIIVIVSIIALLGIAIVVAPPIMGWLAKNECNEMAKTIHEFSPLTIKFVNYRNGWFSSDAKAIITLPETSTILLKKNQDTLEALKIKFSQIRQFDLLIHIQHGPIIFTPKGIRLVQAIVESTIILPNEPNQLLKNFKPSGPIAHATMVVDWNSSGLLTLDGAPISFQDRDTTLNWDGIKLSLKFSPFSNQITSKISCPKFDLVSNQVEMHWSGLESEFQGERAIDTLWFGNRHTEIQSFSLQKIGKNSIKLNQLVITSSSSKKQQLFTDVGSITLASLTFNNITFKENLISWKISNLDFPSLANFISNFNQLRKIQPISLQRSAQSITLLTTLLNHGAEINFGTIHSTTPWGDFSANLQSIFTHQDHETDSILALAKDCDITLNLKLHRSLALLLLTNSYLQGKQAAPSPAIAQKQADELLSKWQTNGDITFDPKDSSVATVLNFQKQQLFLNHQPVTLFGKQL